jgi:hypothetical protein
MRAPRLEPLPEHLRERIIRRHERKLRHERRVLGEHAIRRRLFKPLEPCSGRRLDRLAGRLRPAQLLRERELALALRRVVAVFLRPALRELCLLVETLLFLLCRLIRLVAHERLLLLAQTRLLRRERLLCRRGLRALRLSRLPLPADGLRTPFRCTQPRAMMREERRTLAEHAAVIRRIRLAELRERILLPAHLLEGEPRLLDIRERL